MRIGFLVMNVGKNAGGPESYERALLQHFAKQVPEMEFYLYCFVPVNEFIRSLPKQTFTIRDLSGKSRLLSLAVTLPRLLKKDAVDFFHAPFVPPPFTRTPYVFTHHCFSPYKHPEFYDRVILARLRPLITRGLSRAKHVLCVSENVLQLSEKLLKVPASRMSVVHNGVDTFFQPVEKAKARMYLSDKYGIDKPFFFFAGKLQKRKNIARILQAYRQFLDDTSCDIDFVLAGSRTWAADDLDQLIEANRLTGRVRETGYIDLCELPNFYSACEAFVFVSLWEGFGIPLIEAMACGAPTITSNLSSLPEIAGDAALLVDPYSVSEISEAMKRVVQDDDLQAELRAKGAVQSRRFSWERCARETLQAYREHFAS